MASSVSLFPQFMAQLGAVTGGTIIVGGLGVEVAGELTAAVEQEIVTADISEVLVPMDASNITVTVEGELGINLETC